MHDAARTSWSGPLSSSRTLARRDIGQAPEELFLDRDGNLLLCRQVRGIEPRFTQRLQPGGGRPAEPDIVAVSAPQGIAGGCAEFGGAEQSDHGAPSAMIDGALVRPALQHRSPSDVASVTANPTLPVKSTPTAISAFRFGTFVACSAATGAPALSAALQSNVQRAWSRRPAMASFCLWRVGTGQTADVANIAGGSAKNVGGAGAQNRTVDLLITNQLL
jgi:hypothetical protein